MTKKTKRSKETVDVETTATMQEPEEPEGQSLSLDELRMAYVVGIKPDGDFVFQLFGQSQGLVELLGLHEYAERQVNAVVNDRQLKGDRLVHEVGKAVALLAQKVDQTLLALSPKSPDNEI